MARRQATVVTAAIVPRRSRRDPAPWRAYNRNADSG
jgi:hypothetical protein